MRSVQSLGVAAILLCLTASPAFSATYEERRAAALERCRSIPSHEYSTGLFLNPDGYRSYYHRSSCFQETAIRFRDSTLCSEVRRRYALFSSSWGYSVEECQRRTNEGILKDLKFLEEQRQLYLSNPIRISDFRIETNGNGRDFDIVPSFTDGYAHSYRLSFEILDGAGGNPVTVVEDMGTHITGTSTNLSLYVRQQDLRNRFPTLSTSQLYIVRATLELSVGIGSEAGWWSDEFIERVFPHSERTSFLEKEVIFSLNARRVYKP